MKKICIRAGHGQDEQGRGDPGAIGGNLKEDNVTLAVVNTLAYQLSNDFDIVVPRKDDTWVDKLPGDDGYGLRKAVKMANDAHCDFFLSIHCNSVDSTQANGTEAVYLSPKVKLLADALCRAVSAVLGTKNRGPVKDTRHLYEEYHTDMPAVILELAFLSNEKDRAILQRLMDDKQLRISLANAIGAVLKKSLEA